MKNHSTYRFILPFIFSLTFYCNANAQYFYWAEQAGGTGYDFGNKIATDINGNIYVSGFFEGTATFGSEVLTSYGERDIFVAKYDANGNTLWAKNAGGATLDHGSGISVDTDGNSYVTGRFTGTANFGSIVLTSNGDADIFIAKYDANGNALWAKNGGGSSLDGGYDISVDANGRSYVTGFFNGTATFGSEVLTSYGGQDIFIAKYDAAGNVLWAEHAGGTDDIDNGEGIATDISGNCYVTGYFDGTATFGSIVLNSFGTGADIFVAKYDVSGNALWAKNAGNSGSLCGGYGISVDTSGNSYVTGIFWDSATFGSILLTSIGNEDIFIAKYNNNGDVLWAKSAGGSVGDRGRDISSDLLGNSYVTGRFEGTATFGSEVLTSFGDWDIFIAKYDTYGNVLWVKNAGGIDYDRGSGIAADESNMCYASGEFTGTATFGSYNLTSFGSKDIFVLMMGSPYPTLLSPNGGEDWIVNSEHNITWNSYGIDSLKIEYTTNNGTSWIIITNSTPAGTGSYLWTIPNTPSSQCRVKISDVSNPSTYDISDGLFTISPELNPTVTVISPNGGEDWSVGEQHDVIWNSQDITNVKIEYTTNNGGSWLTIVNSTPAGTGSYLWTIPNTPSSQCRVKISDVSNPSTYDESDDLFTISLATNPVLTVVSPNGGEHYEPGSTIIIEWVSQDVNNVKIEYSSNNGTSWNNIVSSIPASTGSYNWTAPNIASTQCLIKICDVGNPSFCDQSDGTFTIAPIPELTVTTPNGGEVWEIGTTYNITWTSSNVIDVKIEISRNNGASWTEIVSSTPSTGLYDWTVTSPPSFQSLIKISDAIDENVFDVSDNVFSIEEPVSVNDFFSSDIPTEYALYQNFPNPFNPTAKIYYSIAEESFVTLGVYNLLGKEVITLVRKEQMVGNYEAEFDATGLPSGIYFYRLQAVPTGRQAGSFVETKKMILMK